MTKMTREDVLRMAREVGLEWDMWKGGYFVKDPQMSGAQVLERFATLVARWHACDGLPAESLKRNEPLADQIVAALNQRDELLGALNGLVKLGLTGEPVVFTAEYDRARAAIAKAGGDA